MENAKLIVIPQSFLFAKRKKANAEFDLFQIERARSSVNTPPSLDYCVPIAPFDSVWSKIGKTFISLIFLLFLSLPARAAVFYPSHFTLSNGLEVVVVPNHLAPVVSQMVWYKVGAAYETPGKTGLAHYLEHLMFRGTETIPAGEFSKIIASQGGRDNAFTSYDYTVYMEEVAADRLPIVMQMEADRMQNLRLTKETAATELKVVLDERQQRTDNSPRGLFQEKLQSKFMPNYPYGRPIIGWKKDIEKLTIADVRKFYETYYAPNNAIVVISGDVSVEQVMSLAAATYGRVPRRASPPRREMPSAPLPASSAYTRKDARIEQPEVIWRFAVPSYATQKDNAAYAYQVLSEVLESGKVGLLYRRLVTEKGHASSIVVGYSPSARGDTSFSIWASVRPGVSHVKLQESLREALKTAAERGLDEQEVIHAKQRLQRSAIFAREDLSMPGRAFGAALTTGHIVADVETWPDRIDAVTLDQVNAALEALVKNKRQLMGVLLPDPRSSAKKRKATPSSSVREKRTQ